MKLWKLTVPLGLAMAISGGVFMALANRHEPVLLPEDPDAIPMRPRKEHPLTAKMVEDTKRKALKTAPAFARTSVDGKSVEIGGSGRLQFVYFVLEGCPCSFDAEPLFQSLYKANRDDVEFIAVTNSADKLARRWHDQLLVPYPVVSDPKLEIVKAYEAVASTYAALVGADGKIVKMWPGFSHDILVEMNALMAKESGRPVAKFDPAYAPKEPRSGCSF